MSVLIDDPSLADQLGKEDGSVELYTRDGECLGLFTPRKTMVSNAPDLSDEEIQYLLHAPEAIWYTAEEVEARLRELRCSS